MGYSQFHLFLLDEASVEALTEKLLVRQKVLLRYMNHNFQSWVNRRAEMINGMDM